MSLWSRGTSRALCPNRERVETPGHLWATLAPYLNTVGRAVCRRQDPRQSQTRTVTEQVEGSPEGPVHNKRRWSQGLNKTVGSTQETGWRHKRSRAHLPCPSGWDRRLRLELKGNPWTGETRAQVEGQNEVFQDTGALRTDAQLLSATS